jgi:hypothetical protein
MQARLLCMQVARCSWPLPRQGILASSCLMQMMCVPCCRVALRIMEVPLAEFVSPVPLEDPPQPNVVLASLGRPLFISWHPDGSTIVQVSCIWPLHCTLLANPEQWASASGQAVGCMVLALVCL